MTAKGNLAMGNGHYGMCRVGPAHAVGIEQVLVGEAHPTSDISKMSILEMVSCGTCSTFR